MSHQRFEVQATIGGFDPEEVAGMPYTELEERDGLRVATELFRHIERIRQVFTRFMDSIHNASHSAQQNRMLLFNEALMNLVLHGNKGDPALGSLATLAVELDAVRGSVSCILELTDHSPPFDIASVPDPAQVENLERPTGRGILLIRELCHATISQVGHPDGGKTVTYAWTEETAPEAAAVE